MKSLFVGNLPFKASESQLEETFSAYGRVHSVKLLLDRETGRPRGFGFIQMDDAEAAAAIAALDGSDFGGRPMRVSEAREREERPRAGDGGSTRR